MRSRNAREFIGSDSEKDVSFMKSTGEIPEPIRHTPVVLTEVKSSGGCGLWVIKNFSKLDDSKGFCVFSPEFQMAGNWWKFQLFPSGGGRNDNASSEGHVSTYLFATRAPLKAKYSIALLHPIVPTTLLAPLGASTGTSSTSVIPAGSSAAIPVTAPVDAGASSASTTPAVSTTPSAENATIATPITTPAEVGHSIVDREDEIKPYYVIHGSTKRFGSPVEGWGFLKFFPRKQLIAGPWAIRDEIRLYADVSVVHSIHHTADWRLPGNTHLSSITQCQNDFEAALESGENADIYFKVHAGKKETTEPVTIPAHKSILKIRSKHFKKMFTIGMVESWKNTVVIEHCRPSVFKEALRFLYTGACDLQGLGQYNAPSSTESSIKPLDDDEQKRTTIEVNTERKESVVTTPWDELKKSIKNHEEVSHQKLLKAYENFGKLDDTQGDSALELLCIADLIDAADLYQICTHFLADTLTVRNCINRLRMANLLQISLLEHICIKFIASMSLTCKNTPLFKEQLKCLSPELLIEVMTSQPPLLPSEPPISSLTPGTTAVAAMPALTPLVTPASAMPTAPITLPPTPTSVPAPSVTSLNPSTTAVAAMPALTPLVTPTSVMPTAPTTTLPPVPTPPVALNPIATSVATTPTLTPLVTPPVSVSLSSLSSQVTPHAHVLNHGSLSSSSAGSTGIHSYSSTLFSASTLVATPQPASTFSNVSQVNRKRSRGNTFEGGGGDGGGFSVPLSAPKRKKNQKPRTVSNTTLNPSETSNLFFSSSSTSPATSSATIPDATLLTSSSSTSSTVMSSSLSSLIMNNSSSSSSSSSSSLPSGRENSHPYGTRSHSKRK